MLGIIPAAGAARRLQPLPFSKELLPVATRTTEGGERPRAVSEMLIERLLIAGATRLCFVVAPRKLDIISYYGAAIDDVPICYAIQPEPTGLCDAVFRGLPFASPDELVTVGLPDTVWFPTDGLLALPRDVFSLLLFPVEKPELFDAVRKNLDMTMYYVHPNGEIVTDASGRQDKAVVGTLENYYYPYRYFAIKDGNGQYAAMCRLIEKTAGPKTAGFLDYFLTDPSLWAELPGEQPVPVNYVKTFPNSGLVRIRRDNRDSTLIANNPVWFTFMKGNAVLQGVRFASSFFGKGQFQSEKINENGKEWVLSQKLDGPYYQPYPKESIAPDGDWEKMPRNFRPQSEVQALETKVMIRETSGGMEIEVVTNGTECVPAALELIFRPGGTLKGVSKLENTKDSWLLKEATGSYELGGDTITFGPGLALHKNVALRGALPAMEAPTVFITGFTPFKHVIRFS